MSLELLPNDVDVWIPLFLSDFSHCCSHTLSFSVYLYVLVALKLAHFVKLFRLLRQLKQVHTKYFEINASVKFFVVFQRRGLWHRIRAITWHLFDIKQKPLEQSLLSGKNIHMIEFQFHVTSRRIDFCTTAHFCYGCHNKIHKMIIKWLLDTGNYCTVWEHRFQKILMHSKAFLEWRKCTQTPDIFLWRGYIKLNDKRIDQVHSLLTCFTSSNYYTLQQTWNHVSSSLNHSNSLQCK